MNRFTLYILLLSVLISLIGLCTNLSVPELRGEEPLRMIVSYEMDYFHNYLQPTFLGEIYTHKPPLYNWTIILSSKIFGWGEITIRAISVLFTFFTTVLTILFSYKLFKNLPVSVLSGAIYITFLDIIAYYGWIGEMDAMFTFFVFILFILVFYGFKLENRFLIYFSGLYTGFIFMFKGFNAFPFFSLTYVANVFFFRRYQLKTLYDFVISFSLSLLIPVIWFLSLNSTSDYFTDLSGEVVNRVEYNFNLFKFLEHILTYPLINFKQLFLTSVFVFLAFVLYRKELLKNVDLYVKLILLIIFLNYIPYLIAAGGSYMYKVHGRHIMPLFPLVAILFAYFLYRVRTKKLFYIFLASTLFISVVRIPYGTEILGKLGKPSRKAIAKDISHLTEYSKNVACHKNCKKEKAVCFYYSVLTDSITLSPVVNKNWDYLISCEPEDKYKLLKSYRGKFKTVHLYKRGEDLSKSSPEVFQ